MLIGIWVAIYGIDSWRREHAGKRQIELAEETLALFYEAQDVIAQIRHSISWANETAGIERGEQESDEDFKARKSASIVFTRYNEHQELFNKIYSLRYRFMAQIGKEEAVPFDELRAIVQEIFFAARMLAKLWARANFGSNIEYERHLEQIQKYEDIFWDGLSDEDPINKKLAKTIKKIEATCNKAITGAGTLHGFLNLPLQIKICRPVGHQ